MAVCRINGAIRTSVVASSTLLLWASGESTPDFQAIFSLDIAGILYDVRRQGQSGVSEAQLCVQTHDWFATGNTQQPQCQATELPHRIEIRWWNRATHIFPGSRLQRLIGAWIRKTAASCSLNMHAWCGRKPMDTERDFNITGLLSIQGTQPRNLPVASAVGLQSHLNNAPHCGRADFRRSR